MKRQIKNVVKPVYQVVYGYFCHIQNIPWEVVFVNWQITVRFLPVDAACDKVGFCDEYGAGVYYVLDCSGAGARREIDHDATPQ